LREVELHQSDSILASDNGELPWAELNRSGARLAHDDRRRRSVIRAIARHIISILRWRQRLGETRKGRESQRRDRKTSPAFHLIYYPRKIGVKSNAAGGAVNLLQR
jgi:hypothetical protein